MKLKHLSCLMLIALLLLSACGANNEEASSNEATETNNDDGPKVISAGFVTTMDHLMGLAMQNFKEEVEERSNGEMVVDLFPQQQLGTEPDMLDQARNGTLDIASVTVATMGTRSNAFNAWFMPYLLGSLDAIEEMRQTEIADKILNSIDDSEGLHPIGYYIGDDRNIISTEPVTTMEDLDNLQIRIPPGVAGDDFYNALNATPTAVEITEVYSAFQTGVLDAADADLDAVISNNYYEVANHLTLTGHHDWMLANYYSKSIWDELTDEEQQIILDSMEAAAVYTHEKAKENREILLDEAKENGLEIHEFEEMDEMLKVADEIHEKYSDDPLIAEFIEKGKEIGEYY